MGDVNNTERPWGPKPITRDGIARLLVENLDSLRRLEVERDEVRTARATENGRLEVYVHLAKQYKDAATGNFVLWKDELAQAFRELHAEMQRRVRASNDLLLAYADVEQHLTELIQERRRLQYPNAPKEALPL